MVSTMTDHIRILGIHAGNCGYALALPPDFWDMSPIGQSFVIRGAYDVLAASWRDEI